MKFIKDTLITFSSRVFVAALSLVIAIVIARILGPEGKGAYSLIILLPTILVLVGNLGIGLSNTYFGRRAKYAWTDLTSNSVLAAFILGIFWVLCFLAYYYFFNPSFLSEIKSTDLLIAIFVVPFSLLITYCISILLGQDRIKEYNLVSISQVTLQLLLVLLLLLLFKLDVLGTIIAWTIATFVTATFSVFLVRRNTKIELSVRINQLKDQLSYGVKGYLGNVLQFLNYRVDMLLVALFMSTLYVGYYSISVVIAEALWLLPTAVGAIIFARTAGISEQEADESTPVVCRNTLFLTFISAVLLFVLSKYIIKLFFGPDFLPAVQPLWILLPGVVALSICKVLSNEIAGRGKPIINTYAAGMSLIVNIFLNIWLIPIWGISGAALASTVSYTLTAAFVLTLFLRISHNGLFDTIVIKKQDLKLYKRFLLEFSNFMKKKGAW